MFGCDREIEPPDNLSLEIQRHIGLSGVSKSKFKSRAPLGDLLVTDLYQDLKKSRGVLFETEMEATRNQIYPKSSDKAARKNNSNSKKNGFVKLNQN